MVRLCVFGFKRATNPRQHKEEIQNTYEEDNKLIKSNKLSLLQRDDCKTRMDNKNCITKQEPNTKHQCRQR